MKNFKRNDWIGLLCGILVIAIAIGTGIVNKAAQTAGVSDKDIPAAAQTLTGTAQGRNGPITVEVVADSSSIYRITVLEQAETEGIGSEAVKKMPLAIFQSQSLKADAITGSTISSDGIRQAVYAALQDGGIDPAYFGGALVKADNVAKKIETGTGITVLSADKWAEEYPEIYASYMKNSENKDTTDYVKDYPMIHAVYEGMAFNSYYDSARGHSYTVNDITSTGRPHKLANCFTCKTPDFTVMVNNEGDSIYSMAFEDAAAKITENISCYNCHANEPGEITVTHTYLTDAVGEDFEKIDAADLACGQCHVEYYFAGENKATTLPYTSLADMNPDDILAFYNETEFTDYTNPRTGVKQIKVQHPEFETFLGEGSVHRDDFTCADCHMGEAVAEDGTTYKNHYLTSPLDNEELIEGTCAECHTDLKAEVAAIQEEIEARTYSIGYELEWLTEKLAAAVESGEYSDAELDAIRAVARDAQFYWDFVFVENSEGAHNSTLNRECLDKAEALANEALAMFK